MSQVQEQEVIWKRFRQMKCDLRGAILLLHIRNSYYALYEDAQVVSRAAAHPTKRLHGTSSLVYCETPAEKLEEVVAILQANGHQAVVVERPRNGARSVGDSPRLCRSLFGR